MENICGSHLHRNTHTHRCLMAPAIKACKGGLGCKKKKKAVGKKRHACISSSPSIFLSLLPPSQTSFLCVVCVMGFKCVVCVMGFKCVCVCGLYVSGIPHLRHTVQKIAFKMAVLMQIASFLHHVTQRNNKTKRARK